MNSIKLDDTVISIPMPLYLQIEDVGWWQGQDGSPVQQPFRNGFCRRHCLEDYQSLSRLARKLSMRLAIGMVIGEWDRSDHLKRVPGATWMGDNWNNSINRGPLLDRVAAFLNEHHEYLEIALHGLCHEFWLDGVMQRSEFHTEAGIMRPPAIIHDHLQAFMHLLTENHIRAHPRLFIPPALNHSFGNCRDSMQAILKEYGIEYVITKFSRARQYSPPIHPKITWEEEVVLLDRGDAPVPWHETGARVPGHIPTTVVPLHWSNLLHPDPAGNKDIVDHWAEELKSRADKMDCILAADVSSCFRQAAFGYLAELQKTDKGFVINIENIPRIASLTGSFVIKIRQPTPKTWHCKGGRARQIRPGKITEITITPDRNSGKVLFCLRPRSSLGYHQVGPSIRSP